jgi:hypothetical protein
MFENMSDPDDFIEAKRARFLRERYIDLESKYFEEKSRANDLNNKLERLSGLNELARKEVIEHDNAKLSDIKQEIEKALDRLEVANMSAAETERTAKLRKEVLEILNSDLREIFLEKEFEVRAFEKKNIKLLKRVKYHVAQTAVGVVVSVIAGLIVGLIL